MTRDTLLKDILEVLSGGTVCTIDADIVDPFTEQIYDVLTGSTLEVDVINKDNLNDTLLSEVTTTTTSDSVNVAKYRDLTIFLKSVGTIDATLAIQGSPNDTDWANMAMIDISGTTIIVW